MELLQILERVKSTILEDNGLAKGKRKLYTDEPVSWKLPKIEESKPAEDLKFCVNGPLKQARLDKYYNHLKTDVSVNDLALKTRSLVPKDCVDLVDSIIYRMRLKWFDIADLLEVKEIGDRERLNIPLRMIQSKPNPCPSPPELGKIDMKMKMEMKMKKKMKMDLFREGVSDEELCLELQSAVEKNSAVLGESCVKSVAKLLDCFNSIDARLKELKLEPNTGSEEEDLETEELLRAARSAILEADSVKLDAKDLELITRSEYPGLPSVAVMPGLRKSYQLFCPPFLVSRSFF